jgi:hypothetical protein
MFFTIVTQPLEVQIPILAMSRENETNLIELLFSFLIHFAIFEECTLIVDPHGPLRVFLVLHWHIACKFGREREEVLVG